MSNEIDEYKKNIKNIKPLLINKRQHLDVLKKQLDIRNRELDKYKCIYDEKLLSKNDLLLKIESIVSSTQSLDLHALSNAKYYLSDVNEMLIDASSSLKSKEQAADYAGRLLTECHVDVKLLETYEGNKKADLGRELEKLETREIEDIWLQSRHNKLQNGSHE